MKSILASQSDLKDFSSVQSFRLTNKNLIAKSTQARQEKNKKLNETTSGSFMTAQEQKEAKVGSRQQLIPSKTKERGVIQKGLLKVEGNHLKSHVKTLPVDENFSKSKSMDTKESSSARDPPTAHCLFGSNSGFFGFGGEKPTQDSQRVETYLFNETTELHSPFILISHSPVSSSRDQQPIMFKSQNDFKSKGKAMNEKESRHFGYDVGVKKAKNSSKQLSSTKAKEDAKNEEIVFSERQKTKKNEDLSAFSSRGFNQEGKVMAKSFDGVEIRTKEKKYIERNERKVVKMGQMKEKVKEILHKNDKMKEELFKSRFGMNLPDDDFSEKFRRKFAISSRVEKLVVLNPQTASTTTLNTSNKLHFANRGSVFRRIASRKPKNNYDTPQNSDRTFEMSPVSALKKNSTFRDYLVIEESENEANPQSFSSAISQHLGTLKSIITLSKEENTKREAHDQKGNGAGSNQSINIEEETRMDKVRRKKAIGKMMTSCEKLTEKDIQTRIHKTQTSVDRLTSRRLIAHLRKDEKNLTTLSAFRKESPHTPIKMPNKPKQLDLSKLSDSGRLDDTPLKLKKCPSTPSSHKFLNPRRKKPRNMKLIQKFQRAVRKLISMKAFKAAGLLQRINNFKKQKGVSPFPKCLVTNNEYYLIASEILQTLKSYLDLMAGNNRQLFIEVAGLIEEQWSFIPMLFFEQMKLRQNIDYIVLGCLMDPKFTTKSFDIYLTFAKKNPEKTTLNTYKFSTNKSEFVGVVKGTGNIFRVQTFFDLKEIVGEDYNLASILSKFLKRLKKQGNKKKMSQYALMKEQFRMAKSSLESLEGGQELLSMSNLFLNQGDNQKRNLHQIVPQIESLESPSRRFKHIAKETRKMNMQAVSLYENVMDTYL